MRMRAYVGVKSLQSRLTLWDPIDCSPPGSSVHGDSPGKNTGVGCRSLLQGIFPTQGPNLCLFCLRHWQLGSLPLVSPGKPMWILHVALYRHPYLTICILILFCCKTTLITDDVGRQDRHMGSHSLCNTVLLFPGDKYTWDRNRQSWPSPCCFRTFILFLLPLLNNGISGLLEY